jgi:acetyl esterase
MAIAAPDHSETKIGDEALDAELRPIVQAQRARARDRGSLETVTPAEMRARAAAEFEPWNRDPQAVARVSDLTIGRVPLRLYDPAPGGDAGLLVYLHGGGWVIGDLDLEDAALRHIACRSGVRILSVDYRLAPEHPFPCAIDDAEEVIRWAAGQPAELGVGSARLALGGASAGANLALGAALRLRDRGAPALSFLLLMYGAYSGGVPTPSYRQFGDGRFGLPSTVMDWFWTAYAGAASGPDEHYAIPLKADLTGLPPAFVNHAELDILRDDTLDLVRKLRTDGVSVSHRGYAGAVHGFTQYARGSALARRALDDAADALAEALG